MMIGAKQNIRSIFLEAFGEPTDHPLLARFLAFVVDFAVLLLFRFAVNALLMSLNKHSPSIELILDVVVCTIYFMVGNSMISKGQTLGKRMMRLIVIDTDGNFISFPKSFIRAIPVVLVHNSYAIMGLVISDHADFYVLVFYTLAAVLFGNIYYPLVTVSRQGLHDLLVSSHVTPVSRPVRIEGKIDWPVHIVFILIVIAFMIFY
jgi:uncharacterized RDD family membrane protein YckC